MKPEMPKAYEPQTVEDGMYAAWEESGFFNPDNLPGERTGMFSIVLPPPNATGTLHMGHAVMLAIEDAMTRFARMTGKKTLWVPGTDHAAIATNAKVEKILAAEGKTKYDLGRDAFLARVREFVAQSQDTIRNQMRKMGASVDWSREAYTLDDARSRSVRTAFKMMYDDGLIYRGNRVINWCPHCASTLADDEVEHKETTAKFFTFRYDANFPIAISSTRPETKLGDTAVAVHPSDDRYRAFVGQTFSATFAGKTLSIRVVADEGVDPNFGTGALGVTPSHSQIDAEIANKNGLPFVTVIGEDGKMTSEAGAEFAGLEVKAAREKVVEWLRGAGLLEKEEEVAQNLSICYRCGTPVEPLPKLQWFINVNKPFAFRASTHAPIEGIKNGEQVTLKLLMQHVVRSGQTKIMPERFEKTYFHWIDNLRDWNISRQIWFGHEVPVWYKGEEIHVGEPPQGDGWTKDPDTLDTWFSSGLWTISTLGWPDKTAELETFHPTSVLETGYDILFFWVARMILMTTYAVGEVPFKTVYLHGLVRDEQGRKMSKSLGNIIDPLDMIKKYGADATRLSLVIGSTPGNDTKLSEEKVAGYRNFANKLWNISRFVLTSTETTAADVTPATLADRWILGRYAEVVQSVTQKLERYEFSSAGEELRDFTWSEFADWYLEIAKIQRGDATLVSSTDAILRSVLFGTLKMWHPFMPFVTEEIWKQAGGEGMMMVEPWPTATQMDGAAAAEFALVRDIIVEIRNLRAQNKIEPARKVDLILVSADRHTLLTQEGEVIKHLARVETLTVVASGEKPAGAASAVSGSVTIYLPLSGLVDVEKEKARLTKELASLTAYVESTRGKLGNAEFTAKAPAKVVDEMKSKLAEAEKTAAALAEQLKSL